ncbi:MAG: YraN family protein [Gemmatimonadales bacterium]|jgi:putative endonuclease
MDTLGRRGERLAAAHLEASGCRVLARNWRAGRLEIDLVVRDGAVIAFVEVKTRRPGPQHPSEAVDRRKRKHLVGAARRWIATRPEVAAEYRFDVVSVLLDRHGRARVRHDRSAFTAGDA